MKLAKHIGLNNNKGIVLLLSLGLLALLSMLVLTFTVSTTISRKIAKNYDDLTIARMIAMSGLHRVIAGMSLYSDYANKDFADVFSKNQEAVSDDVKRENLGGPGLLQTIVNGVTHYSLEEDYEVTTNPTWQYLPFDHGIDTPIIGRFAYVVVANSGKIDPSACIDSGYVSYHEHGHSAVSEADKPGDPGSEAYDGQNGVERTSWIGPDADDFVVGRPGRDLSEIFLRCMDDGDDPTWLGAHPSTKKYVQKLSSFWASPAGKLRLKGNVWIGRWPDFDTLFDKLGVDDEYKDKFKDNFTLDNPPDPEAFWIDDNDFVKTTDELYHRFNLTRSDWNDITVDSIKADPINYSTAYSEASTSIPWLKNWTSAGEMGSSTACKNQIIANLIDYSDIDSSATTDSEDNPTYVGLEQCPYINEVKFTFEGQVDKAVVSEDIYNYTCNVYLKQIAVELVNMYNTGALNTTATVSVVGSYTWNPGYNSSIYKGLVRAATTAGLPANTYNNGSLGVGATITANANGALSAQDGITLMAGDLLLVKNEAFADAPNNGIYTITQVGNAGTPFILTRAANNDEADEFANTWVTVSEGITLANATLKCTAFDDVSVGTTPVAYAVVAFETDVAFAKTVPIDISAGSESYGYTAYDLADSDISPANNTSTMSDTDRSVTSFRITDLRIKVKNNSDFYDYSYIIENPTEAQTLSSNGDLSYLYFDSQIADPRQNLLETDWTDSEFSTNSSIGTISSTNSNFTPNPGGDTDSEDVSDPWEISTAFVRNAPMKSPWELGFIHRGNKWQTINLKKYNSSSYIGAGGGNGYTVGDANILDQIKMTEDVATYGKVNLNTSLKSVLKALFQKIRVGSDIKEESSTDGPGALTKADGTTPADEVDADMATAFANDVLNYNGTNGGGIYYTRAQLLRSSDILTNSLCYDDVIDLNRDNDATQEEIIGKFMNLAQAQASSNEPTVIVIAQTIDDIGVPGTTGTVNVNVDGVDVECMTGRYDLGGDKILATQKIMSSVIRNPDTHTFSIKKLEYLIE